MPSGVLINYQEELGLWDIEISDHYLPDYYRADARTGSTRLNIILTDFHSGSIFGVHGNLLGKPDGAAAGSVHRFRIVLLWDQAALG
ncbi:MAG: hypothetical protein HY648_12075 [Acidobacteria bacterium]|nr:hypothetical protein [Acidobacteriota bacterium]